MQIGGTLNLTMKLSKAVKFGDSGALFITEVKCYIVAQVAFIQFNRSCALVLKLVRNLRDNLLALTTCVWMQLRDELTA